MTCFLSRRASKVREKTRKGEEAGEGKRKSERGNNGSIRRANREKGEYRGGRQITRETELLHIEPLSPLPTLCAASRPPTFHSCSLFSNGEKPRRTFAPSSLQPIRRFRSAIGLRLLCNFRIINRLKYIGRFFDRAMRIFIYSWHRFVNKQLKNYFIYL